ncbi:MAG: SOS response-associated peptidase [Actinobacteria bacterium]|nr:SOS response-associated peptidase [Actinomycetota bacterium]
MCGRYALSAMISDIAEEFSTNSAPDISLPADWNIKPTKDIYIIKNQAIEIASWGMIAPWSKSDDEAARSQTSAINARSESVHEKPTFRSAFRSNRCLIPASGYYEWASELGKYKTKQPIYVSRDDNRLLAFSGIFQVWTSPSGKVRQSVAIVTRQAIGQLALVHSRMPVFLPKERWMDWMNPRINDIEEIRSLMDIPTPDAHLRFHPVSSAVNSITGSGPGLIEAIELGEPETLF